MIVKSIMTVELAKHIETLLLENDCVIVPEFGGFIVHNVSAQRDERTNTFLPPHRTLGFNPQLNLNDGLLIQSYMSTHDVNYPQAQRMVESAVRQLRSELEEQGYVELHGVGRLSLNIEDKFVFSPCESGLCSPLLYGFPSFQMDLLPEDAPISIKTVGTETSEEKKRKRNTLVVHIDRRWLNNAVAVVLALVLYYFLSVPVDNTYVEPESYASVGNVELFNQIRSQSVATTVRPTTSSYVETPATKAPKAIRKEVAVKPETPKAEATAQKAVATAHKAEPVAVKAEPAKVEVTAPKAEVIAPKAEAIAPKAQVANTSSKRYHIIVASVLNDEEAEKTIQYFASKGYPGATAVKGEGRVRIAMGSFADRQEAENRCNELHKEVLFQNAWICPSRN